jgi:exopolysaccharide biosynthesis protein
MKKLTLILLSVLLVLTACTPRESIELTASKTIAQHVVWKVIKTNELDINGLPASINILDVDLKKFNGDIDLAWYPEELVVTSKIAQDHDALAAVNGSFFDMKVGGAWVFLQDDGQQVAGNKSKVIFSHNGAFAEDTKGNIVILERPETDWEADPAYDYVMSSGPLMIYEGDIYPMDSVAFNLDRHPRTAVGLTKDKHLILVTVDGRQKDAVGMSIPELTKLMEELKCTYALNLDGGGSTTMYIKGEDHQGIVNYPTDNRIFDHEGERPVSNAILILE